MSALNSNFLSGAWTSEKLLPKEDPDLCDKELSEAALNIILLTGEH